MQNGKHLFCPLLWVVLFSDIYHIIVTLYTPCIHLLIAQPVPLGLFEIIRKKTEYHILNTCNSIYVQVSIISYNNNNNQYNDMQLFRLRASSPNSGRIFCEQSLNKVQYSLFNRVKLSVSVSVIYVYSRLDIYTDLSYLRIITITWQ